MMLDEISKKIILIALYLDDKVPGIVSEIWIDETELIKLKNNLPTDANIVTKIEELNQDLQKLNDERRKEYLETILESLSYQISHLQSDNFSFSEFSEKAFGFKIQRVDESELEFLEKRIHNLETKINFSRQQVFQQYEVSDDHLESKFKEFVQQAKKMMPTTILDFPDQDFEFEVTSNKPWSAFNSHIAPYKSKLTLNKDVGFSQIDLYRLAFHEAYGGHHSELSNKDRFLTKHQRGEHGLVITFSPQTFISEAIAEGIYVLLGGLDETNDHYLMGWYYDRLIFALQNAATFWFFDDKLSKAEIASKLQQYAVSEKTAENILNFSTDPLFGKYAPVYYTAFNFLENVYSKTSEKKKLIYTLFTQPCTPAMIMREFST